MSTAIYTKVDLSIQKIMDQIEDGYIGLPDLQRPFVWPNKKIRDLFDSLYRGYPIGYLLFWQNSLTDDASTIGINHKQKAPNILIVDGQQRLTSLYAVIKGHQVIRENYLPETISIAFNPLEEKFEVADAAIIKDKAFIPNISKLWDKDVGLISFLHEYISNLSSTREVNDAEKHKIERSIETLKNLPASFSFTALELSSNVSEEQVAEVFVRINSTGKQLNQADFILTLMSVFWDDGRTELEQFCREARGINEKGEFQLDVMKPRAFNNVIKPDPDQLVRVCVGLGFKRARLNYVYAILRGKDLETEQFSDERRDAQFAILKKAQDKALNLQYWHDYLKAIQSAGYKDFRLITSNNNVLYSYVLYLIGRTEYHVEDFALRKAICRWFFMTSLRGRYTGSPESAFESDLSRIGASKNADGFIDTLDAIGREQLTNDFWEITLPGDLATSSSFSPSLVTYAASLNILGARILFSDVPLADSFNSATVAPKSAVERHHLFPKAYLARQGIGNIKETNQIANMAYVEWADNVKVSDLAPSEYAPKLYERFSAADLENMYYWHALPNGWETMDYFEFLQARRVLIAKVIKDAYQCLFVHPADLKTEEPRSLEELLLDGESTTTEFKSTLRMNLHTRQVDPRMEHSCLKTIAAFLNSHGGTLIIGVSDDGVPLGIENDKFESEDKMSLHLTNLLNSRFGPQFQPFLHQKFDDYNGARVLVVECKPSKSAVYMKDGNTERFFIRAGSSSTELIPSQIQDYIKHRFI